jgi:hypothetical protein
MLEKELKYFQDNKDELLKAYAEKYIVIVGQKVVAAYNTENEAFVESQKSHKPGSFLIKLCSKRSDTYTQTFHSRVAFR